MIWKPFFETMYALFKKKRCDNKSKQDMDTESRIERIINEFYEKIQLIPTQSDVQYILKKEIEKSGHSSIWLAEKILPDTNNEIVVIKRASDIFIEFLKKESEFLSEIEHPNIIKSNNYFEENRNGGDLESFIELEYIDGIDATTLCYPHRIPEKKIHERITAIISHKVAKALEYIHSKKGTDGTKYIHGDIKLENIMISKDGQIKVIDFGLTRTIKQTNTDLNRALGTPAYRAPERKPNNTETIDQKSDMYSLGVSMYRLLTYKFPEKKGKSSGLYEINIPEKTAITELVEQMMNRKPVMRPSANSAVKVLENYLGECSGKQGEEEIKKYLKDYIDNNIDKIQ